MKRIHIIGSGPRTGTTLLAEVMHTCFKIDHHCEHEAPICTDEPKEGNIFLTKQPGEMSAVRWPLRLNQDLYVICIIRDPRDSIVSFHGSKPGIYWTGLRYWRQFTRLFPDLSKHPRFIHFRYEDFVHDPDAIQNLIKERIPFLEETHKFSDYHLVAKPSEDSLKALRSVRQINPVGLGTWKKHLPRVKQQIQIHGDITQDLIDFGYEIDSGWAEELVDVEAEIFKTHLPETWRLIDTYRRKRNQITEVFNIIVRKIGLSPGKIKSFFK